MGSVNLIWGDHCSMGPQCMAEDLCNYAEAKEGQEKQWRWGLGWAESLPSCCGLHSCCREDDLAACMAHGEILFWNSATTELPWSGESDEHLLLSNALLLLLLPLSIFLLVQYSWCPWTSQKTQPQIPKGQVIPILEFLLVSHRSSLFKLHSQPQCLDDSFSEHFLLICLFLI